MTTKNDGGHAFPQIDTETVGDHGEYQDRVYSYGGMTLRDYFAAKAMQAAVSTGDMPSDWVGFHEAGDWAGLAKYAYQIADAMLDARSGT